MKKIFLLIDYRNRFGSKYNDHPYRSGMDKELLNHYFMSENFNTEFVNIRDIDFTNKKFINNYILYTSSEDKDNTYKNYIEDIVMGLEIMGAITIPPYKFLKAHNNKIFMEILRDISELEEIKTIKSHHFGCIEDIENVELDRDVVFKTAEGAMSRGVFLLNNKNDLKKIIKKKSHFRNYRYVIKDFLRKYKHKGYIPESRFQSKFILQNLIKGLDSDWKVLIFWNRYYVIKRKNRKNDFRASGGGRLSYEMDVPKQILDFAYYIFQSFNVPHISLDIGFDGQNCHLIEFQAIYFGTYTLTFSEFYFVREQETWKVIHGKSLLEEEYVKSVVNYIKRKDANSIRK